MKMNIYVGNLSYQTSEDELKAAFEEYGEVEAARIITERDSGRSKGFGFVEMPEQEHALAAIEAMNENEMNGRKLIVNKARPKPERREHGGGFGGRGRNRY